MHIKPPRTDSVNLNVDKWVQSGGQMDRGTAVHTGQGRIGQKERYREYGDKGTEEQSTEGTVTEIEECQ